MTITYSHEVADARLCGFSRLLLRWKGSVYKLFYVEFLIFICLYGILSMVYRLILVGEQKVYFEKLCIQFHHYTDLVPISFVLGFYVTMVVGRWWSQFEYLPFPDRTMMLIGSAVHGADDRGRMLRRTLLRYMNLAQVLAYRCVSTAVYKRFPTIKHLVVAGIMTESEYEQYESIKSENLKYWIPLMWFSNLLAKVRQEGRIYDDMTYKHIMEELNSFRTCCGMLIGYDWVSIPLVYTQVVTVAVYVFFGSTLLSRQFLDTNGGYSGHEVDLYIPVFTIAQFFFYMGWLKVAEQLINPFGEDDDDFEVNSCIDRNLEVSFLAADQMYAKLPKLEKDRYWNDPAPVLPYTDASHRLDPFMGSTFDMRVSKSELEKVNGMFANKLSSVRELPNNKSSAKEKAHQFGDHDHIKIDMDVVNNNYLIRPVPSADVAGHRLADISPQQLLVSSANDALSDESIANSSDHDERDDDDDDVDSIQSHDFASKQDVGELIGRAAETENPAIASPNAHDEKHLDNKAPPQPHRHSPTLINYSSASSAVGQQQQQQRKSPKKRQAAQHLPHHKLANGAAPHPGVIAAVEVDSDRENAHRRVLLAKRKRMRHAVALRRMQRTAMSTTQRNGNATQRNQQQQQQRSRRSTLSSLASPDYVDSAVSGAGDSPFGSIASFAASIPSPRQLRWTFRAVNRTLSATSSMPSPSGNDATDASSTHIDHHGNQPHPHHEPAPDARSRQGGDHVTAMPFTENLRRRLQVVTPHTTPRAVAAALHGELNPLLRHEVSAVRDDDDDDDARIARKREPATVPEVRVSGVRSPTEVKRKKTQQQQHPAADASWRARILTSGKRKVEDVVDNQQLDNIATRRSLWDSIRAWSARRKELRSARKNGAVALPKAPPFESRVAATPAPFVGYFSPESAEDAAAPILGRDDDAVGGRSYDNERVCDDDDDDESYDWLRPIAASEEGRCLIAPDTPTACGSPPSKVMWVRECYDRHARHFLTCDNDDHVVARPSSLSVDCAWPDASGGPPAVTPSTVASSLLIVDSPPHDDDDDDDNDDDDGDKASGEMAATSSQENDEHADSGDSTADAESSLDGDTESAADGDGSHQHVRLDTIPEADCSDDVQLPT